MKKLVLMVMAGVMGAALLAGCGSSKKDETAAEATTESVPEQITVDYSTGLNEDGTLANVNAADYVTVCQYTNLEIPRDQVEVTKDEVQEQIDSLLSSHTTENEITDRKIKDGDLVNIDYEGTIDGTAFDGGTAQGQRLTIGSGTFIDNFEEQLVGKKPGEEVDVTVTFPEDYAQADLAGKEAVFKVKINSIIETVTPELTDEFVKENYEASQGVATVKELKKKIKTQLQDSKYTNYLWNYLLENSTFKEIPADVVNPFVDVYIDSMKSQLAMYGYNFEDYLKSQNIDGEDALKEKYYSTAEESVKVYLIADAIAKEQDLKATDEDIKTMLQVDNIDEYVEQYTKAYLNRYALNELVIKKIRETSREVEPATTEAAQTSETEAATEEADTEAEEPQSEEE